MIRGIIQSNFIAFVRSCQIHGFYCEYSQNNPQIRQQQKNATRLVTIILFIDAYRKNGPFFPLVRQPLVGPLRLLLTSAADLEGNNNENWKEFLFNSDDHWQKLPKFNIHGFCVSFLCKRTTYFQEQPPPLYSLKCLSQLWSMQVTFFSYSVTFHSLIFLTTNNQHTPFMWCRVNLYSGPSSWGAGVFYRQQFSLHYLSRKVFTNVTDYLPL